MKFNIGDKAIVTLNSKDYTGRYAGTDVVIVEVSQESYCNVQGFDGKQFICPLSYLVTYDEFYNPPAPPKCGCGAKYTSRQDYHLDFCPLYEEK